MDASAFSEALSSLSSSAAELAAGQLYGGARPAAAAAAAAAGLLVSQAMGPSASMPPDVSLTALSRSCALGERAASAPGQPPPPGAAMQQGGPMALGAHHAGLPPLDGELSAAAAHLHPALLRRMLSGAVSSAVGGHPAHATHYDGVHAYAHGAGSPYHPGAADACNSWYASRGGDPVCTPPPRISMAYGPGLESSPLGRAGTPPGFAYPAGAAVDLLPGGSTMGSAGIKRQPTP
eukprot:5972316-Prymnesium_polylepis.1